VVAVAADTSDDSSVRAMAQRVCELLGGVDVLVNGAARVSSPGPAPKLAEVTDDALRAEIETKVLGYLRCARVFAPGMAARGWGRIINVTSQQAGHAFANSGGYGASKGGVASLTRSQSEAWGASGVCCNNICPGFVPTRLNAAVANDPVKSAAMAARTMVNRNGDPADFAGATVFLASRASDYVTGHTLYVDGGFAVT
jgi:gluconate 5-dehydrogenase